METFQSNRWRDTHMVPRRGGTYTIGRGNYQQQPPTLPPGTLYTDTSWQRNCTPDQWIGEAYWRQTLPPVNNGNFYNYPPKPPPPLPHANGFNTQWGDRQFRGGGAVGRWRGRSGDTRRDIHPHSHTRHQHTQPLLNSPVQHTSSDTSSPSGQSWNQSPSLPYYPSPNSTENEGSPLPRDPRQRHSITRISPMSSPLDKVPSTETSLDLRQRHSLTQSSPMSSPLDKVPSIELSEKSHIQTSPSIRPYSHSSYHSRSKDGGRVTSSSVNTQYNVIHRASRSIDDTQKQASSQKRELSSGPSTPSVRENWDRTGNDVSVIRNYTQDRKGVMPSSKVVSGKDHNILNSLSAQRLHVEHSYCKSASSTRTSHCDVLMSNISSDSGLPVSEESVTRYGSYHPKIPGSELTYQHSSSTHGLQLNQMKPVATCQTKSTSSVQSGEHLSQAISQSTSSVSRLQPTSVEQLHSTQSTTSRGSLQPTSVEQLHSSQSTTSRGSLQPTSIEQLHSSQSTTSRGSLQPTSIEQLHSTQSTTSRGRLQPTSIEQLQSSIRNHDTTLSTSSRSRLEPTSAVQVHSSQITSFRSRLQPTSVEQVQSTSSRGRLEPTSVEQLHSSQITSSRGRLEPTSVEQLHSSQITTSRGKFQPTSVVQVHSSQSTLSTSRFEPNSFNYHLTTSQPTPVSTSKIHSSSVFQTQQNSFLSNKVQSTLDLNTSLRDPPTTSSIQTALSTSTLEPTSFYLNNSTSTSSIEWARPITSERIQPTWRHHFTSQDRNGYPSQPISESSHQFSKPSSFNSNDNYDAVDMEWEKLGTDNNILEDKEDLLSFDSSPIAPSLVGFELDLDTESSSSSAPSSPASSCDLSLVVSLPFSLLSPKSEYLSDDSQTQSRDSQMLPRNLFDSRKTTPRSVALLVCDETEEGHKEKRKDQIKKNVVKFGHVYDANGLVVDVISDDICEDNNDVNNDEDDMMCSSSDNESYSNVPEEEEQQKGLRRSKRRKKPPCLTKKPKKVKSAEMKESDFDSLAKKKKFQDFIPVILKSRSRAETTTIKRRHEMVKQIRHNERERKATALPGDEEEEEPPTSPRLTRRRARYLREHASPSHSQDDSSSFISDSISSKDPDSMCGSTRERESRSSTREEFSPGFIRRCKAILAKKSTGSGDSPLHHVCRNGKSDMLRYFLLMEQLKINVQDNAGWTPLHEACNNGHKGIVETLLQNGADPNLPAYDGTRPIHDAVEAGNLEIVSILVKYGADPLAEYCERNPLELAGSAGYPDIVHFLQGVVERRKKLYQKGRVSKRVSASPKSNTKRSPSPFAVSEQAITLPIDTYTEPLLGSELDQPVIYISAVIEMSNYPLLPVYNLTLSSGPNPRRHNFHFLHDVLHALSISREELLSQLDVTTYSISIEEFIAQLKKNPLSKHNRIQSFKRGTILELVPLCNSLRNLFDITVENIDD